MIACAQTCAPPRALGGFDVAHEAPAHDEEGRRLAASAPRAVTSREIEGSDGDGLWVMGYGFRVTV